MLIQIHFLVLLYHSTLRPSPAPTPAVYGRKVSENEAASFGSDGGIVPIAPKTRNSLSVPSFSSDGRINRLTHKTGSSFALSDATPEPERAKAGLLSAAAAAPLPQREQQPSQESAPADNYMKYCFLVVDDVTSNRKVNCCIALLLCFR